MSNITIGRYESDSVAGFSGWIEGVDNAGQSWITYLGRDGRPVLHWPAREADGAVVGDPITLAA